MQIQILRFVTGEEIIGDYNNDGEFFSLANPCLIDTQIGENGKVKTNLYPMALYSKDRTVNLNLNSIMYTSAATEEIIDAYTSRFNKIAVPPKKIILS